MATIEGLVDDKNKLLLYPQETSPIRDFRKQNIYSAKQFDRESLEIFYERAQEIKRLLNQDRVTLSQYLKGFTATCLFLEESTRTRHMFQTGVGALGGTAIPEVHDLKEGGDGIRFSSMAKGETWEHTIRVMSGLTDAMVLRHPRRGFILEMLPFTVCPLISAGDGDREHPPQALKDYYTVRDRLGRVDGLRFTFVGDNRYSRTVHSFSYFLSMHKVEVNIVSPQYLKPPREMIEVLQTGGVVVKEFNSLREMEEEGEDPGDILYMTRLQTEREENPAVKALLKEVYNKDFILDPKWVDRHPKVQIMHPLPIGGREIPTILDFHPQAIYFEQSDNGRIIAGALLHLVIKG